MATRAPRLAAQLADVQLAAARAHAREARVADVAVVRPHDGLRARAMRAHARERAEHVRVAQVPARRVAAEECAVVALGVRDEARVLLGAVERISVAEARCVLQALLEQRAEHVEHGRLARREVGVAHGRQAVRRGIVRPAVKLCIAAAGQRRHARVDAVEILEHGVDARAHAVQV